MREEEVVWWTDPLPKLADHLHKLSVGGVQDLRPITTGSALFQARVAWESSKEQGNLIRSLVRATWSLVGATLLLAAVAIFVGN